jgi:hypothetical protein
MAVGVLNTSSLNNISTELIAIKVDMIPTIVSAWLKTCVALWDIEYIAQLGDSFLLVDVLSYHCFDLMLLKRPRLLIPGGSKPVFDFFLCDDNL